MTPIQALQTRQIDPKNQERAAYLPSGITGQPTRIPNTRTKVDKNAPDETKNSSVNAIFDHESVIQIRDDDTQGKIKAKRLDKLLNKQLRKLATESNNLEGFLSIESASQSSLINVLEIPTSEKGEVKRTITKPGGAKITPSQARREQEELEEIDQIMEDMCAEEAENGAEKSISPSAPILLSQKADLLQDALKEEKEKNLVLESENSDDIEAILGFGDDQKKN